MKVYFSTHILKQAKLVIDELIIASRQYS